MIPFDLRPHLVGELIELRPMRADDWKDLYSVASDQLIWDLHPARDRHKQERFREYFEEGLQSGGALVAIDRKADKIIGASRYFWFGPEQAELEIGWTFLARSHWGGVYNAEMKRFMLDYAFQFVDRVDFSRGHRQHSVATGHAEDWWYFDRSPRSKNSPRTNIRVLGL
jgi:RimJ/RimL family protein N-acetyltransferase